MQCFCGSSKGILQCCLKRAPHAYSPLMTELQTARQAIAGGSYKDALSICEKILRRYERFIECYYLAALSAHELRDHTKARRYATKGLLYSSENPYLCNILASTYSATGNHEQALTILLNTVERCGSFPEIFNNLGNTFCKLTRYSEAYSAFSKALALNPGYTNALVSAANTLRVLHGCDRGIAFLEEKASAIRPSAKLFFSLGLLYRENLQYDKALPHFLKAYNLDPGYPYVTGEIAWCKLQLCDWQDLENYVTRIEELISRKIPAAHPFTLMPLLTSQKSLYEATTSFVEDKYHPEASTLPDYQPSPDNKISIGYFSPDFYDHPLGHLFLGILRNQDKSRFSTHIFNLNPHKHDAWTDRIQQAADTFHNIQNLSDHELTKLVRSHNLDIAIDLAGHTGDSRLQIFINRVAPIQMTYLGYLGTTAIPAMDYIIAASDLIPKYNAQFFSETPAVIEPYQPSDPIFPTTNSPPTRSTYNLPEDAFVYVSFNSNYKITPQIFDAWCTILRRTTNSVLWLLATSETAKKNLVSALQRRGIEAKRLIFADPVPRTEHLRRYELADLFLDTTPCNAGATAQEALRMGIPLLTLPGETFSSRIGLSILRYLGQEELIARSTESYIQKAVDLASDRASCNELRKRLAESTANSRLFDVTKFTQNFEDMLLKAIEENRRH